MRTWMTLCALLLAPSLLWAQEERPEPRGGQGLPALRFLNDLELTQEQKQQVNRLRRELAPQIREVAGQVKAAIPESARKAAADAVAKAKAEGKRPREIAQIREQALGLTDEQKAQMAALQEKQQELNTKLKQQVMDILTDEQKAQLKPANRPERTEKPETR